MSLQEPFHGSSPLTRGKRGVADHGWYLLRLIPAHAGKTSSTACPRRRSPAHPRSRGENSGAASNACVFGGSSPLTRGKRSVREDERAMTGLIPAHAGKTAMLSRVSRARRAHPRSRGENQERTKTMALNNGSSPLTRGKLERPAHPGSHAGLIPAHAGKTVLVHAPASYGAAHPRSRGENHASDPVGL